MFWIVADKTFLSFKASSLPCIYHLRYFIILASRNTVDGDPRWCCTYLLDPSDPLFVEIGEAFIRKQIKGVLDFSFFSFPFLNDVYKWRDNFHLTSWFDMVELNPNSYFKMVSVPILVSLWTTCICHAPSWKPWM